MKVIKNLIWMNILHVKCLEELFFQYILYLNVDLANSLINKTKFSRNVNLLVSFRDIFLGLYNPEYNAEQDLEKLKKAINVYNKNANTLAIQQENMRNKQEWIKHIPQNEDLRKICVEYYHSNKKFSDACETSLINKDDFKDLISNAQQCESSIKHSFAQPLLEFNNALSHLAIFIYNSDINDKLQNVKKAQNHIYRATLDNYKMILRFTIPNLQNKENILQSFRSMREQEFLLLGENFLNKKINYCCPIDNSPKELPIIAAYKELAKAIFNSA
ncbi:hypothetical protein [Helicobacter sp. UBA3407]|uniref:hypothetical protein n=1 Tax=Helicobacter sp. UBA3407 TaxID=1946588 RepID=UPI00262303EC|nr:hypothetical protein [Helicobacter sp. UBA3407]